MIAYLKSAIIAAMKVVRGGPQRGKKNDEIISIVTSAALKTCTDITFVKLRFYCVLMLVSETF